MPTKPTITLSEARRRLGVSLDTVRRWCAALGIEPKTVGPSKTITDSQLRRLERYKAENYRPRSIRGPVEDIRQN